MARLPRVLAVFLLSLVCAFLAFVPLTAAIGDQTNITVRETYVIDDTGRAKLESVWSFTPAQTYDRIKQAYPNLYLLFRDLGNDRSAIEIDRDTFKIVTDDQKRTLSFSSTILGFAACKKSRWEAPLGEDEEIAAQDANKVFTTQVSNPQYKMIITTTCTYLLPAKAQNVAVDKTRHLLTYTLPHTKVTTGEAAVDVNLRHKEQIMSALYKIYADPAVGNGAYWVAKAIVTNTGNVPLYDLKISYKLGDYCELSVPERYSVVMPGGTVVDLYYPFISAKVTELKTRTPARLYVKYEYTNPNGKVYTEELEERLDVLGINQFVWSNLSRDELTDSWYDYFNNAPLIAAFVTRMDDVVKQFAGYVSEAAGGAGAALNDKDATKWLRAAYDTELQNNIVYQTPSGFMTTTQGAVQEIKYPRDVFRDKSGTCVDLAITYAALAETTGLRAYIMMIPGHAFAVIELPSGDLLPVENTGLGGGSNRLTFDQAVEVATKELQEAVQKGVYYFVDVREELTEGRVPNPELPAVSPDFLKSVGIKRLSELKGQDSSTNTNTNTNTNTSTTADTETLFSDDFGNPNSGWGIERSKDEDASYVNYEYEVKIFKKTLYSYTAPLNKKKMPPDYTVQVDARVYAGLRGYYGLIFNMQDWDSFYYLFVVDPGYRAFALWKVQRGEVRTVADWANSNLINENGTNRLAIGVIGNQAVLFVNNQRLTNGITMDSVAANASVGVTAGNFGILPVTIRFDNFLVTNIPK